MQGGWPEKEWRAGGVGGHSEDEEPHLGVIRRRKDVMREDYDQIEQV